MKRLVKVAMLTALMIAPTSIMTAQTTYATNSTILEENPSVEVEGKTYYDTGYVATVRGLVDDYDGTIDNFKNKKDVKYKRGIDPNTIIVEMDFYTQIFATKDFPKDKIPEEVYRANYIVIGFNNENNWVLLKYLSEGGETAEALKDAVYMADAKYFKDNPVKVGDKLKLWHWFPTNGDKELMIPEIYKIETLKAEEGENTKPENRPMEYIPPEAAKVIFVVKEIRNEGDKPVAVLYQEDNPKMEYVLDIDQFRDDDVDVNNRYKIYWDGVALESFPAKFGHIYRVDKLDPLSDEEGNLEEKDYNKEKELAISMFDNLVKTRAASILLEQSPKTVEKIKPSLSESMGKSNTLMDKAYNVFLTEEEKNQEDKSIVVVRIIQYRFDKKLETDKEQELAKSVFQNMIMTEASKMLLEQTPETVKDIESDLRAQVEKSNTLVESAFEKLQ